MFVFVAGELYLEHVSEEAVNNRRTSTSFLCSFGMKFFPVPNSFFIDKSKNFYSSRHLEIILTAIFKLLETTNNHVSVPRWNFVLSGNEIFYLNGSMRMSIYHHRLKKYRRLCETGMFYDFTPILSSGKHKRFLILEIISIMNLTFFSC